MDNPQVTSEELYWFFGLVDGDGSFLISNTGGKKGLCLRPGLKIANTNPLLIEAVSDLLRRLKLPKHISSRIDKRGNRKILYSVTISGLRRMNQFFQKIPFWEGAKKYEYELVKRYVKSRLSKAHNAPVCSEEWAMIERLKKGRDGDGDDREIIFAPPFDERHWAWLAGLWDADGTLGIYKVVIKWYYYPVARFLTVNPIVFKQVKELLRSENIAFSTGEDKQRIKVRWNVTVTGKRSVGKLVEKIKPYLKGKRLQADIIEEFNALPKTWKKYDMMEIKKKLAKEIQRLNFLAGNLRDCTPPTLRGDDTVQPLSKDSGLIAP